MFTKRERKVRSPRRILVLDNEEARFILDSNGREMEIGRTNVGEGFNLGQNLVCFGVGPQIVRMLVFGFDYKMAKHS